jgi:hypothetical protein
MALTLSGSVLSKISFCDKQCSNVNDNKFKAQIIQTLDTKYKIQVVTRDYNILNPNILRNVSYHQHILSTYSNGNPYMLYLTKIDGINCTIFIDKKLKDGYTYPKMHCVKYRFSDDLFNGETIFTGELVRDNERRWFFLIDNILLYKGLLTNEKNVLSRFELIHNILANEYTPDKYLEICPISVKKLFLYKDIKKMVTEFIPNLSYVCKGIIFYTLNNKHSNYAYIMPRDTQIEIKSSSEIDDIVQEIYPDLWDKKHSISTTENNDFTGSNNNENINCNFNEILKKDNLKLNTSDITDTTNTTNTTNTTTTTTNNSTKPVHIEIDNVVFKIMKTDIPDIYNLYCIDDTNSLQKHSIALVPNIKISHYLYNTFITNPNNFGLKIECKYSQIFEKWTPIRFVDNEPFMKNIIDKIEERLKNKD